MPKILKSNPYRIGAMGSLGNAAYMLIRQYQYPVDEYSDHDTLIGADHDRLFSWDYDHTRHCFSKYTGTGELGLERWAAVASEGDIIKFLSDILKADNSVNWTGFRIMGTVHRGNGYPVWTLELFAKSNESVTRVTDNPHANKGRETHSVNVYLSYLE